MSNKDDGQDEDQLFQKLGFNKAAKTAVKKAYVNHLKRHGKSSCDTAPQSSPKFSPRALRKETQEKRTATKAVAKGTSAPECLSPQQLHFSFYEIHSKRKQSA